METVNGLLKKEQRDNGCDQVDLTINYAPEYNQLTIMVGYIEDMMDQYCVFLDSEDIERVIRALKRGKEMIKEYSPNDPTV